MTAPSIIWFSRLYLAGLATSALDLAINWNDMIGEPAPDDPLAGTMFLGGVAGIVTVASFALSLLLWHLVMRRASRAAKWILVVFAVITTMSMAALFVLPDAGAGNLVLASLATALHVAAVVMLFRPDASAWFRGDRIDPQTFA